MAQAQVPDETVSAAGVFQPRGTQAGMDIGAGGAGNSMGHGLAGVAVGAISIAVGRGRRAGPVGGRGHPALDAHGGHADQALRVPRDQPERRPVRFEMQELFRVGTSTPSPCTSSGRVGTRCSSSTTTPRPRYEFEGFAGWQHANVVMKLRRRPRALTRAIGLRRSGHASTAERRPRAGAPASRRTTPIGTRRAARPRAARVVAALKSTRPLSPRPTD